MSSRPIRVFLDANVIAKPVTRTLLMAGGPLSGFHVVWSEAAEKEAIRHMPSRAVSPAEIRRRFGGSLTTRGRYADQFTATDAPDRQILADAAASKSAYLITENVADFAEQDLDSVGLSAVNPDLFLATYLTRVGYAMVIDLFVHRQVAPPTTAAQFHSAIARQHPLLFAAHADLYDVLPQRTSHRPPAVLFRGSRPLVKE